MRERRKYRTLNTESSVENLENHRLPPEAQKSGGAWVSGCYRASSPRNTRVSCTHFSASFGAALVCGGSWKGTALRGGLGTNLT